jgi:hypothetical protein
VKAVGYDDKGEPIWELTEEGCRLSKPAIAVGKVYFLGGFLKAPNLGRE